MTRPIYRWSPEPQSAYPLTRGITKTTAHKLSFSDLAWNLAWLSFDFHKGFPDDPAAFDAAVTATLASQVTVRKTPYGVRPLCSLPARSFAAVITASSDAKKLPLVKLLGPGLIKTWAERADLARSEHPASLERMLEYSVEDTTAAKIVLQRFQSA